MGNRKGKKGKDEQGKKKRWKEKKGKEKQRTGNRKLITRNREHKTGKENTEYRIPNKEDKRKR